jgi:hypothetical protein
MAHYLIKNHEDFSKIVQNQIRSASHAPSPSRGLISPSQILRSAPELYHMDVDSDFLEPSHESMKVNQYFCWPITDYSFIT